jgi:hypothetical protein
MVEKKREGKEDWRDVHTEEDRKWKECDRENERREQRGGRSN